MLCQKCHDNPATVHVTEIINNQKIEHHYCEDCARDEGVAVKAQINLQDVLSGMLEAHESASEEAQLACPDCGITYSEFRNEGRLGCPHDYEVFAEPLADVFEKVHGSAEHLGKVPKHVGEGLREQRELMQARRRLQEAVEAEDYERAAQLRDEINEKESAGDA